jgi:hypothetical protein
MATFRVGVGSFNIKDGAVGFGTDTDGLGNLKVKGVTKTTGSIVSGASTLTRYSGFAADNINQLENITLTSEVGTIGDIVVGVGTSVIISSASTVTVGTVESVSIGTHFSPPKGGIEERGQDFLEGMMRFNTDLNTMEFYNGNEWRQFTYISDVQNSPGSRGRALFAGGDDASGVLTNISSLQFMTLGNAVFFGDLTVARTNAGGCSSEIRAVFAGGEDPSTNNTIDYNAIASGGTGADFGNLASAHRYKAGCSSSTRGLFGAGSTPSATNVIEYVEIMTTGDAVDFGDLMGNGSINSGSFASQVRGFFVDKQLSIEQEVQVVTIASKGNSISYLPQGLPGGDGDGDAGRGCSNSFRGIFVGAGQTKNIDCIDLVSDGITYDFGDMTQAKYGVGCSASPLRGVLYGGWTPTKVNTIEFVSFASMGDAVDFGDATHAIRETASNVSDCHGGLGGY